MHIHVVCHSRIVELVCLRSVICWIVRQPASLLVSRQFIEQFIYMEMYTIIIKLMYVCLAMSSFIWICTKTWCYLLVTMNRSLQMFGICNRKWYANETWTRMSYWWQSRTRHEMLKKNTFTKLNRIIFIVCVHGVCDSKPNDNNNNKSIISLWKRLSQPARMEEGEKNQRKNNTLLMMTIIIIVVPIHSRRGRRP